MEQPSFTEAVRQELANQPLGSDAEVASELAALYRFTGSVTVLGGTHTLRLHLISSSGAVARRAFVLTQKRYGIRPELAVLAPSGVRRGSSYEVRLGEAATVAADLGLTDDAGRPVRSVPQDLIGDQATAYLRGAILSIASFSAPGRSPHLELRCASRASADGLEHLLSGQMGQNVTVATDVRNRVVVKSGAAIGDLLILVGASGAFVRFDERRMRRRLRNEANRLTNADAANVRRTIQAASQQIQLVESVLARVGWDALDDELRDVALVRLANPAATLQELGQLLDPPVGKSTVHRRLSRLMTRPDDGPTSLTD